jgi:hypothetical protein
MKPSLRLLLVECDEGLVWENSESENRASRIRASFCFINTPLDSRRAIASSSSCITGEWD